jgi:hypothetical protein
MAGSPWQQVGRRHLRRRVERVHVGREAADDGEPACQPVWMRVSRQGRPREHRGNEQMRLPAFLNECDELGEQLLGGVQFESERPADREVIEERLPERGHATPPGHGRAIVRSAVRSTFA